MKSTFAIIRPGENGLNLPLRPSEIIGPLVLTVIAVVFFLLEPMSSTWLAYDRALVKSHELWRLISGNLIHTNLNHLLLNLAGLILLWALHGHHYRVGTYLIIFSACCLGCTLGIYFFDQQLLWYVGLSGALHGLLVWGACQDIRSGAASGWILLVGLWGKIAVEQTIGPSAEVASLINASVAIESHLFGAITGMFMGGLYWITADKN